ncbi:hypothetical protein MBLNU459_g2885t1 [Dothideomycetes sp. NU459]
MATVCARPAPLSRNSPTPTSQTSINTSVRGTPSAVPNKHLPICSPGPRPKSSQQLATPPSSPASSQEPLSTSSLLHPPHGYLKLNENPPVYALTGDELHDALEHIATQPLPDPKQVFPWLHGLHRDNSLQLAFFLARKRNGRRAPRCIRGLTLVKAGGDLSHSKLKGAIAPDEILLASKTGEEIASFLDVDPREGFSVRNFQIQAAKMATLSDVVVYGDDKTPKEQVQRLAAKIARAQKVWREKDREEGVEKPLFSTYVLQDAFSKVKADHKDIVSIDEEGEATGNVMDFFNSERVEMHTMSKAAEIAPNVWVGPTPDSAFTLSNKSQMSADTQRYDLFIEATDLAPIPDSRAFTLLESLLANPKVSHNAIPQLEFPGSGSIMPPTWSQAEVDALMQTCEWIHRQASGIFDEPRSRKDSKNLITPPDDKDADGDSKMVDLSVNLASCEEVKTCEEKKILLHCADGYTETSLLALTYYMYVHCVPVHRAYVELHTKHKRNFFSYPTDVALLTSIQPRILQASPKASGSVQALCQPTPKWMHKMDGSLPSRIMDYMYLGNLAHANNPELLREMGIGQVLSVGEPVSWSAEEERMWIKNGGSGEKILYVNGVQDNGVDPLTEQFEGCLAFIEKGRKAGIATLVHCRVGVSRSATICIAEVMNELGLSFPRAYCFVRARRLNVIIQPHLRFSYELLKWEEYQCKKRGQPIRREFEWAPIAREIAAMNRPYSRQ